MLYGTPRKPRPLTPFKALAVGLAAALLASAIAFALLR